MSQYTKLINWYLQWNFHQRWKKNAITPEYENFYIGKITKIVQKWILWCWHSFSPILMVSFTENYKIILVLWNGILMVPCCWVRVYLLLHTENSKDQKANHWSSYDSKLRLQCFTNCDEKCDCDRIWKIKKIHHCCRNESF